MHHVFIRSSSSPAGCGDDCRIESILKIDLILCAVGFCQRKPS